MTSKNVMFRLSSLYSIDVEQKVHRSLHALDAFNCNTWSKQQTVGIYPEMHPREGNALATICFYKVFTRICSSSACNVRSFCECILTLCSSACDFSWRFLFSMWRRCVSLISSLISRFSWSILAFICFCKTADCAASFALLMLYWESVTIDVPAQTLL